MNITLLWFLYTFAAILGMVGYDVAIKLATEEINAYLFTTILVLSGLIGHLVVLLVYKLHAPEANTQINLHTIGLAAIGGLGLVVMDVCFFLGVKTGGLAATNAVWLIGGLILTVLVAFLFFNETITLRSLFGVLFGIVSIFLMVV